MLMEAIPREFLHQKPFKIKGHLNLMRKATYDEEYHSFFHKRLLSDKRYYIFRAQYSKQAYWSLFKNPSKGIFIEFGCGIGQNIFLQRENTIGIDISDFARKKCSEFGIKTEKSIEKIRDSSIDGIFCCHVLEHLEEPSYFLKQFLRVLKKDGRLVLVLPISKTRTIKKPDFKSWHLYNWNVPAIWALLQTAGFKVQKAQFNYASGFSAFYKMPAKPAFTAIKLLGYLRNQKEMIIIADKP